MKKHLLLPALICFFAGLLPAGLAGEPSAHLYPGTLAELLKLEGAQLTKCDIAWTNLLCAEGLPGSADFNRTDGIYRLDNWADKVRAATAANFYRFQRSPAEFENSEPFYRMLVLITVIAKDCGAAYNPALISAPKADVPKAADFLRDPRDLFLHGLLAGRQMGTCASMPVLIVATGRRLGYPLKLVEAKTHLFARWESADGNTRMNIESTHGLSTHPDDYYKKWPFAITEEEIASAQYLKSLEPAEELAVFMVTRACCLESNGKWSEATEAMAVAHRLAPKIARYAEAVHRTQRAALENDLQILTPQPPR